MCPLKDDLKAEALRLGFSLFGVTLPDTPDHLQNYLDWIQAGHHAAMDYLARQDSVNKRANPRFLMPEVKSIVVLGANYPFHCRDDSNNNPLLGQVSAYAWSVDYHKLLKERANQLLEWLKTRFPQFSRAHIYIDSAPVLERSLAWRAGLGWIGRNGCLIHPRLGSFFFLVEIFLDIDISLDEPVTRDLCGNCHRCLDACPTHCILPNRTIDARRCISFLTIENKGDIPRDLRPAMGSRIFGCDVCQQVCPWNQKAFSLGPSDYSLFQSQPLQITLMDAIHTTKDEFFRIYQYSPILRAHYEGFLRNIIVAMGNSRDECVIPALVSVSEHSAPLIRSHVAWALGQFQSPESVLALKQALQKEQHPSVLEEIRNALNKKTSQIL